MEVHVPYIVALIAIIFIVPVVISMMLAPPSHEGFINLLESKRFIQSKRIALRKTGRQIRNSLRDSLKYIVKRTGLS